MSESPSPIALPPLPQGRYRLGPVIGRGRASTVYRARDQLLGRDVAVKAFTIQVASPEDLQAQQREASLLARLSHPGLVTLLDAGIDLTDPTAPQVFLIMELVPDTDLRQLLRTGPLDPLHVAYLGSDLLSAIQYVHERGIIHRDLKPANVLLTEAAGRPPRGKLADFGIAVLRGGGDEPPELTTGTAAYLSPEQVEGRAVGPEADIYSLGLILVEACTGRPAFPGSLIDSVLARLDSEPSIPADLPKGLAAILRRMTARTPDDRPTAAEAATAFRRLIVEQLGGERPPSRDPESERLEAVRRYNLMDTPPDAEFDRITSLAVRLFNVPIAAMSIVDDQRIWLKSRQGIDATQLERSRDLGSAGGLHDQILVVEDVETDPRTAPQTTSAGGGIRFYAGVPLITGDNYNVGTFAIADTTPHHLSAPQIAVLEDLAAMVLHEMELRRAARHAALTGLGSDA
jgi:serine/threonine protein kinase